MICPWIEEIWTLSASGDFVKADKKAPYLNWFIEIFGQYSDAALQAPGLINWVLSYAYRGFTPASWAVSGGGTVR